MGYMTQISRDDVLHLAHLSGLQLADNEIDTLQKNIAEIVAYIQQLDELDTVGVSPTYQVTGLSNVWRDDVVDAGEVTRDQLLSLAPSQEQGAVRVPKVL